MVKSCLAYERCSSASQCPHTTSCQPRPRGWSLLGPSWDPPASFLGLGLGSAPSVRGIPGAGCRVGHSQHSRERRAAACSQVLVHGGGGGSQSRLSRPAVQRLPGGSGEPCPRAEQDFLGSLRGGLWLALALPARMAWQRDQGATGKSYAGGGKWQWEEVAGALGFARLAEDRTVRNWGCLGLREAGRPAVRSRNRPGGQDPQALWGLPGSIPMASVLASAERPCPRGHPLCMQDPHKLPLPSAVSDVGPLQAVTLMGT